MKTLTLTNQELISYHNGLMNVGDLKGVRFAYAVARNLSTIKDKIQSLAKAQVPSQKYLDYRKEVEKAQKANQKANLKPIEKRYKKVIKDFKEQEKEFVELLKEETKVQAITIPRKDLPEDITAKQLSDIITIIED